MRALLPAPAADVDVHQFYAADWLERGGVRAVFVAATDGAAWANGRSAGLQTPGDNVVFHAMRDLADRNYPKLMGENAARFLRIDPNPWDAARHGAAATASAHGA